MIPIIICLGRHDRDSSDFTLEGFNSETWVCPQSFFYICLITLTLLLKLRGWIINWWTTKTLIHRAKGCGKGLTLNKWKKELSPVFHKEEMAQLTWERKVGRDRGRERERERVTEVVFCFHVTDTDQTNIQLHLTPISLFLFCITVVWVYTCTTISELALYLYHNIKTCISICVPQ